MKKLFYLVLLITSAINAQVYTPVNYIKAKGIKISDIPTLVTGNTKQLVRNSVSGQIEEQTITSGGVTSVTAGTNVTVTGTSTNPIINATTLVDASETVAGKVSVGTQTFGGNKKIVGESSTVGNALEIQNLAHENLVEIPNNGYPIFRLPTGLSTTNGLSIRDKATGYQTVTFSVSNNVAQISTNNYLIVKGGFICESGIGTPIIRSGSTGKMIMIINEMSSLGVSTFGKLAANTIGSLSILGLSKTYHSPIVYTAEANNGATYTGLIGSFHNQLIKAQANNSVLIGMQISPNYNDNTFTGHTKIALGIEASAGFGIYQKGTLVNYLEGSLGIGTTTPNASAKIQVESTTQGFAPPRMTTTQKNAIATPIAGLMVFDTTLMKLCIFTTAWETITSM